jgi:uncharacterized protein (TIGR00730 family)
LEALRERINLIELELQEYSNDFFRVSVFGSARIKEDDPLFAKVEKLAYLLGLEGMDVLTGGGNGLMVAANVGVKRAQEQTQNKSKSIGLTIALNRFESANSHLDIKTHHRKFSSRLDDFMRLSHAMVVTPGGIGTVLELTFTWQLLQLSHITERPMILLGEEFWKGFLQWIKDVPLAQKLISPEDMKWFHIVNTPEEAVDIIRPIYQKFKDQKGGVDFQPQGSPEIPDMDK